MMNNKIDKDYWVNAYQRILGVRPETFYRSFDIDPLEDKKIETKTEMNKEERIIKALERMADALEYANLESFEKLNMKAFNKHKDE